MIQVDLNNMLFESVNMSVDINQVYYEKSCDQYLSGKKATNATPSP